MPNFVVFLLLLSGVTAHVSQNAHGISMSLIRRETRSEQFIREGRFDKFRDLNELRRHSSVFSAENQTIFEYGDANYVVVLYVGTPPQDFQVVPDLVTSASWVVDSSCWSETDDCPDYCTGETCSFICEPVCCGETATESTNPCEGKHLFVSENSQTYVPLGDKWSSAHDRLSATGFLGYDTFGFRGYDTFTNKEHWLNTTGVLFAQADYVETALVDQDVDGVLGLAHDITNDVDPFWMEMCEQNDIPCAYSFHLKKVGSGASGEPAGELFFGSGFGSCTHQLYADYSTSKNKWALTVDKWSVNEEESVVEQHNALFDSTTPFIYGTEAMLSALVNVTHARLDQKLGLYVVNCKKHVNFTIGKESLELTLSEHSIIWEIQPNECVIALDVVAPSKTDEWSMILGAPMFYSFCVGFHPSEHMIIILDHP